MSDLTRIRRVKVTREDDSVLYYRHLPHFEAVQIQVWMQRFPDVREAVLEDDWSDEAAS